MSSQLTCFLALMRMDLLAFRSVLFDRVVNFLIWAVTTTFISGYVLPIFGMDPGYGRFFFAGVLASVGMFEAHGRIIELVSEMADDRPILYYATLPIRSAPLVLRIMLSNMLRFMVLTLFVLPVGKLVLGGGLPLGEVRWGALAAMYLAANAFYGSCSVWLACRVPGVMHMSNVWTRIVFPVWFLGGLQFSQAALAQAVPWLAYLNYLNPIMYITEGFRNAMLARSGFLDIWICCLALAVATVLTAWRAIVRFRARLDLAG